MHNNLQQTENNSFNIISKELGHIKLPKELSPVIKQVIHDTGDFDFARIIEAHPQAINIFRENIRNIGKIYTDSKMISAGINASRLNTSNISVVDYCADEDIIKRAQESNFMRSILEIDKATFKDNISLFVIGNSPSAIVRISELSKKGTGKPKMVIAVPSGFVGAEEAKQTLRESGIPYIITRGKKGGSSVAVAITNALLNQSLGDSAKQFD